MKKDLGLFAEMTREFLISKLKVKITDSFKEEPYNSRVEFYVKQKKTSNTVFATTICGNFRQIEIYPKLRELNSNFSNSLMKMFQLLGFSVLWHK